MGMNGEPRKAGERARSRWAWAPGVMAGVLALGLAACGSQSEPWGAGAEEYLGRLHEAYGQSYTSVMQFYTRDVEIDMRSPLGYEGTGRGGIAHAMRERDSANRMVITVDELPYLSLDGAVDPVREHVDDAYGWPRLDEANVYTVTDGGISSMIFTGAVEAWVAFRDGSREVSDPIVMSWLTSWATQDADAVRAKYADDAVLVDSVAQVRLEGADQIAGAAAATAAGGGLPGATLHEIPNGGGPAYYGHGSDSDTTPVFGDRRVLLLSVGDSGGCPGDVAVAQWIDDSDLITREERFHRVDSVRECMDVGSLAPGWWESLTTPDPRLVSTGSLQVGGQEIVLWTGSPEREELLRGALQQFADAGLPPPEVTSVLFAAEVADPWAEYGLDRMMDAALPLTAQGCPAVGCDTWPAEARAAALQSLAGSWVADLRRGPALSAFAAGHDLEWSSVLDEGSLPTADLAAGIIAWGLMDEPYPVPESIAGMTCEQLAADFTTLTSAPTQSRACGPGA